MRIKECRESVVIQKIASVERVFGVDDPVDACYVLGLIGLYRDAIQYLATGVRRLGQVLGESDCRWVEAAWTDLPVWQRLPGGRIINDARFTLRLAAGPIERAEIARERRRSGDKCGACRWVLANIGLLKTTEEE